MNQNRMKSSLLIITAIFTASLQASPRENGFYVGLSTACCSGASDYFETTADINASGNHVNIKEKPYRNSTIWPLELKIGYKHYNNNRLELFRRNTDIDVDDGDKGTITSKVIGINYEWGFTSLSSKNKKFLPFASLGYGWGNASTRSNQLSLKRSDSHELDLAVGVHYQLGKHFDTTLGLYHRDIILLEDGTQRNVNHVFTDGDIAATTLNAGISYHF